MQRVKLQQGGNASGMLVAMLTFRRQKPARLSKNFYEVLLESGSDLIFVKDEAFRIVYANQPFLNLHAPEVRDTVIGADSRATFLAEESSVFNAEDRKAFESGFSEIVEEITDYRGYVYTLLTRKTLFRDEEGRRLILGHSTDITKLAARERALAKSNIALENFAAVAAHDLRAPLASISSSLEAIGNDTETTLGPKALRYIGWINNSVNGLLEQVSHLLSAYKAAGIKETPRVTCDLSVLLEEVKFNLHAQIEASHAKILSSALPCLIVDRLLFRQLLHNLIENSIKYRSIDAPLVILRYAFEKDMHSFALEDNGMGIGIENKGRIFRANTQLDDKCDGCGIGLALCREIVEGHGGRIWLDESYGPGARICFELPAEPATGDKPLPSS